MKEFIQSLPKITITQFVAWWGAIVATLVLLWNIYKWKNRGAKNRKKVNHKEITIDPKILWKQYELHTNLFKSYLDLVIKLNLFYYIITGAILSFYFANLENHFIRLSLVLPTLMSFVFCGLFVYGVPLSINIRKEIKDIADALHLKVWPEAKVLTILLWVFVAFFLLVGLGLSYIMILNPFDP